MTEEAEVVTPEVLPGMGAGQGQDILKLIASGQVKASPEVLEKMKADGIEVSEAALAQAKAEAQEAPKDGQRKVYLDNNALIELYMEDKLITTFRPKRNLKAITDMLASLDETATVSLFIVEDEENSDPLPEGGHRLRSAIFDIEKKPVKEARETLAKGILDERGILDEFQKFCDFICFRSSLVGVNLTLSHSGGETSGFSFFTSTADVTNHEMVQLYTASKEQLDKLKNKLREYRPNIAFPDDPTNAA